MNKIEEAVMYCKLKRINKEEYHSTYLDCILTRKEFNRIYDNEELYKEYLKNEEGVKQSGIKQRVCEKMF